MSRGRTAVLSIFASIVRPLLTVNVGVGTDLIGRQRRVPSGTRAKMAASHTCRRYNQRRGFGANTMDMAQLGEEIRHVVGSAEKTLKRIGGRESRAPVLSGGWSRCQVIGHLIDSASNNHQRFVRAILQDSLEFPAYDQNGWSRVQAAEEADWPLLVQLWASYNRYLAHVIARLPAAKLEAPIRVGQNPPVTLRFVAEDYLRHMVHHLSQIDAAPRETQRGGVK